MVVLKPNCVASFDRSRRRSIVILSRLEKKSLSMEKKPVHQGRRKVRFLFTDRNRVVAKPDLADMSLLRVNICVCYVRESMRVCSSRDKCCSRCRKERATMYSSEIRETISSVNLFLLECLSLILLHYKKLSI